MVFELAMHFQYASGRQWLWPPVATSILFSSAATCSRLQPIEWPPVAASVRQHSLLSGRHLQPLAANRVAASGRQWPPAFSSHRQPLAATCSQSSGRQWPPVSASILFSAAATCSHLQPIEWPQVAPSGHQHLVFHRQPPLVAARILFSSATTCSHLQPIEWPQVAARASGRKWPPLPKSNSCPSARSLQHRVSSSSSWDQQSTSAAAHKRQLHSAVQKQSFTRSTQEQQNHFTSETSYKKHSTPRRWTLGSTQTLRAGRAWQQGLDHQRKQNTSNSNTFSSNNWCNTILWGSSRSTQPTTPRTPSPSTWPPRRSWGISTMLGSQPRIASNSSNQQQFHCSYSVLTCERVYTVRTTCAAYTNTDIHSIAMVLTMVSNIGYNINIFVLHLCVFQHDLLSYTSTTWSVPTWLWTCMTTWLS